MSAASRNEVSAGTPSTVAFRALVATALAVALVATALFAPASAGTREVDDVETTGLPYDVEISHVKFEYSKKWIRARAAFTYLGPYVESYSLRMVTSNNRYWGASWSDQDSNWDTPRRKTFDYGTWLSDDVTDRRCKVRWTEDLDADIVTVAVPTQCVQLGGNPPKWLRMGFSVLDNWEGSYITDDAPGGNSYSGYGPLGLTKRIRRG